MLISLVFLLFTLYPVKYLILIKSGNLIFDSAKFQFYLY
jgi:hypothetical protein